MGHVEITGMVKHAFFVLIVMARQMTGRRGGWMETVLN